MFFSGPSVVAPTLCPRCAALEAENTRLRGLVEKAFWDGVREGGRMVENGEIDVSDVAWLAFAQREGLAPKGVSNG